MPLLVPNDCGFKAFLKQTSPCFLAMSASKTQFKTTTSAWNRQKYVASSGQMYKLFNSQEDMLCLKKWTCSGHPVLQIQLIHLH